MLSPAAVAFFSRYPEGNPFGIKGPLYGPEGHRGQDVPVGAHGQVYALRGGTVVSSARSSVLGNYYVIKVGSADYDGYCHQLNPHALNSQIVQGQPVSIAAGPGDYHGSAWTGPHLHLTNGLAVTSVYQGVVRDPRPIIQAQLTAAAAGGSTPIDNRIPERNPDMPSLFHDLSTTPFLFALAGGSPGTPANWLETSDVTFATQLSAQIGASSAGLSHGSFVGFKAAYLAPVTVAGQAEGQPSSAVLDVLNQILTALGKLGGEAPGLSELVTALGQDRADILTAVNGVPEATVTHLGSTLSKAL